MGHSRDLSIDQRRRLAWRFEAPPLLAMPSRRWLIVLVGVSACVALGSATAGYVGLGPLSRLRMTETRLQPQAVHLLGASGDPFIAMVGVRWTKEGYCSGQFRVQATESLTEVRIGVVTSREYRYGACADLGTVDNMAWAPLRLTSPLGQRVFVRASDGVRLPLFGVCGRPVCPEIPR